MFNSIISNDDSVKLTLEVLHQALLQKQPMCMFARLGGEQGGTISRAAFALIVKFTDSVFSFESLVNQVNGISSFTIEEGGVGKLKEIIIHLESDQSEELKTMQKRWETANQMRKWT